MKTKGKAWHLIATVLLIVVFVYTAFFGVYAKYGDTTTTYIKGAKDIRFGVDIKGGVNVTFVPSDGYDATEEQLEAAQLVIENRLVALNVTDYELYVDNNSDSLILEFPWQSGETDFDPEAAIDEIGTTAYLTFREGSSADGELILDGSMGYIGIVDSPVRVELRGGRIVEIEDNASGRRLKQFLARFHDPENMVVAAEFGIGLNTHSRCAGNCYIEDESTYGTFHIGFGRNIALGGVQDASGHYDLVTHAPCIYVDNRMIMDHGQLTVLEPSIYI
mgnify:CR=1 FL=1